MEQTLKAHGAVVIIWSSKSSTLTTLEILIEQNYSSLMFNVTKFCLVLLSETIKRSNKRKRMLQGINCFEMQHYLKCPVFSVQFNYI